MDSTPVKVVRNYGQVLAYVLIVLAFVFVVWRQNSISQDFREGVLQREYNDCLNDNEEKDSLRGAFDAYTRALIGASEAPTSPEEQQKRDQAITRFKESVDRELETAVKKQDCEEITEDA